MRAKLKTEERQYYYGGRPDPGFVRAADTRRDAGEGLAVASEMIAIEVAKDVVAEAFRLVMVRLRETEHESFTRYGRGATLAEQHGSLVAGFEDVLEEMSTEGNG